MPVIGLTDELTACAVASDEDIIWKSFEDLPRVDSFRVAAEKFSLRVQEFGKAMDSRFLGTHPSPLKEREKLFRSLLVLKVKTWEFAQFAEIAR
jgi:hypothetical protein